MSRRNNKRKKKQKGVHPLTQEDVFGRSSLSGFDVNLEDFNSSVVARSVADVRRGLQSGYAYLDPNGHPLSMGLEYFPPSIQRELREQAQSSLGITSLVLERGGPQRWWENVGGITRPLDMASLDYGELAAKKSVFGLFNFDWQDIAANGGITPLHAMLATTYMNLSTDEIRRIVSDPNISAEQKALAIPKAISVSSGSLKKPIFYENLASQLQKVVTGKSLVTDQMKRSGILVWDIETAGLGRSEGVWEIAASIMDPVTGKIKKSKTLKIRNDLMNLGVSGPTTRPLSELVGIPGDALSFPVAMKEFLEFGSETGFTMAGHNLEFDIGHLLGFEHFLGSASKATQAQYAAFKEAVTGSETFFDTNALSRALLGRQSKLKDLLGSTNILEHALKNGFSVEEILEMVSNLHQGTQDVKATGFLAHLIMNGGGIAPRSQEEVAAVIDRAGKGKGITWDSHFAPVFSKPDKVSALRVRTTDIEDVSSIIKEKVSRMQVWDPVQGKMVSLMESQGISPLEQLALVTRNASMGTAQTLDASTGVEALAGFVAKVASPEGSLRVSHRTIDPIVDPVSEFAEVQARLAKAGVPWSGLGLHERVATSAMARARTAIDGTTLADRLGLGAAHDILGLSQWSASNNRLIKIASGGTILSLPGNLLEDALGEPLGMLDVSLFRTRGGDMGQPRHSIALMKTFGEETQEKHAKIASFISSDSFDMSKYGIKDLEEKEKILQMLTGAEGDGLRYGIQVAYQENQSLYSALESVTGEVPKYSQAHRTPLVVSSMGGKVRSRISEMLGPDKLADSDIITGPVGIGLDVPEFSRLVERDTEHLMSILSNSDNIDLPEISRAEKRAVHQAEAGQVTGGIREIKGMVPEAAADFYYDKVRGKAAKGFEFYRKNAKVTVPLTALAVAGYYFTRKERKQDPYYDTLKSMPKESAGFRLSQDQEIDQMTNPYYGGYGIGISGRAFSTAGVVSSLNDAKIGHTRMGSSKYNYLFGG